MSVPIHEIIASVRDVEVAVLGDAILDVYIEGTSHRISSEAPVPIVDVSHTKQVPGGAANTVRNVATLGGQARFISVVGDDEEGQAVRTLLAESGVDTNGMVTDAARRTVVKSRLLANSQVIVRFDNEPDKPMDARAEDAILARIDDAFRTCDALIISDYGYGLITDRVLDKVRSLQPQQPIAVVVDSKRLPRFKPLGVTAVKPNYPEFVELLGLEREEVPNRRVEQVKAHGVEVLDRVGARVAAVTMDSDGAWIFERGHAPYRTYTIPVENSKAVGAGDTFVSAFSLALGADIPVPACGEFAAAASRIVVEQDGTTPCHVSRLEKQVAEGSKWLENREELREMVGHLRGDNKRIVFTNGVFDILHRGHVTYLNQAKALGDVLIAGVNTDESVRRLKGEGRPITPLEDRILTLSGLSSIDHIVHFDEDTSAALIRLIRPDVYVKGSNYSEDTLPEAPLIKEQGGRLEFLDTVEDRLTDDIVNRVKQTL